MTKAYADYNEEEEPPMHLLSHTVLVPNPEYTHGTYYKDKHSLPGRGQVYHSQGGIVSIRSATGLAENNIIQKIREIT